MVKLMSKETTATRSRQWMTSITSYTLGELLDALQDLRSREDPILAFKYFTTFFLFFLSGSTY
jgi:hypothetical protein